MSADNDIVVRLESRANTIELAGYHQSAADMREAAAEIGRLRGEVEVESESARHWFKVAMKHGATAQQTTLAPAEAKDPAPAMPNGVEGLAGVRDTLIVAANNPSSHGREIGLRRIMLEQASRIDATIRAADNRDAAGVDSEEDAYVIERMGKMLAEIAVIHDLPEKVRALKDTPAAVPAGEAVATVVGYDSWHRVAVDWHKLDMEPGTKLYTTPPAPVQAAPQEGEGYYLASFKHKANNGEVMWWKGDNAGYSPDLEQAGIYTELVPGYHDSEDTVPVPVAFLAGLRVRRTVDPGDSLNHMFWSAKTLRAALQHRGDSRGGEGSGG